MPVTFEPTARNSNTKDGRDYFALDNGDSDDDTSSENGEAEAMIEKADIPWSADGWQGAGGPTNQLLAVYKVFSIRKSEYVDVL